MTGGWSWCKQCESLLVAVVSLCIASICASVAIQIVSRTFGVAFMVWTDEVTRIAILWVTFLGSAVGVRRNAHFVIDMLVEALPSRVGRLFRAGIQFLTFIVVLLLLWTGWQLSAIGLGRVYPITRISQTWAFASVPVGAILMLVFLCEQYVVRRRNGSAERPC